MHLIKKNVMLSREEAHSFLSRKLLRNSWHRFEEALQGNLERECKEEICSYEEAREVFEDDIASLEEFWAHYTGQSSSSTEADNPVALILGVVFGALGLIVLTILVYVCWKKQKGELDRKLHENSQPYTPYPMLSYYSRRQAAAVNNDYEVPLLDGLDHDLAVGLSECYIERERLQLGKLITSGNFGAVYKGKLRMRDSRVVDVAVKSLKNLNEAEDIEKFLREGVMMHGLNHVHVLALIGVCVDSDMEQTSPLIVLPYMDNGDLRSFLRDGNNVLTVLDLLRFCYQVALGMEYLAQKKVVHRDLAARNCMVDSERRVLVADFGLSRDLYDRDYYRSHVHTQLPLKWMAPESIQYSRYDEKTDVWSYGIVTWEILTRGAIPYPTVETRDILLYLNAGNRMERPDCCPYKLYKVMTECWKKDANLRPTFEELVRSTHRIFRDALKTSKRKLEEARKHDTRVSKENGLEGIENNPKEIVEEVIKERPKPKPRTSLKKKSNERCDKYAAQNERRTTKEKRDGDTDDEEPTNFRSKVNQSHGSAQNFVVGEYTDTGREISV